MNQRPKPEDKLLTRLRNLRRRRSKLEAQEARDPAILTTLRERVEELRAASDLARRISSSLSVDLVISTALEHIHSILTPDLAMVYIRDGDRLILRGMGPKNQQFIDAGGSGKQVGQCLCGLAAKTGAPTYSSDILKDPRCSLNECKKTGMRSFAAMPLMVKGDVLGVLGLASRVERDFSSRGPLLEVLTNLISTALHNAIIHAEAKRYAEELDNQLAVTVSATQALRKEHLFISALIEQAAEGICVCHKVEPPPFIRFTLWNRRMTEITGYTMDEVNDRGFHRTVCRGEDRPDCARRLTDKMRRGETLSAEQWEILRADGEARVVSISTSNPEISDDVVHTLAFMHDVTERKRAEEALRKARDELELRVRERTAQMEKANEQLRLVPSKLITVQEEERKRLAFELHDSIGQTLAALKFHVERALAGRDRGGAEKALKDLERFVPTLQRSIDDTRAIYMGLRPTILDNMGVIATIRWLCREFLIRHPNHHIELDLGIEESEVPEPLKIVIFRICQEALSNVARHSRAEWVDLSLLKRDNGIELTISDDGAGMQPETVLNEKSGADALGLTAMRERAELTGGVLCIESAPGEGATVRARWPS